MAFNKLHSSLVNSSLWAEDANVRLLFITLLALADKRGCIYGSKRRLTEIAKLDQEGCQARDPWAVLLGPDPDSSDAMRSPENEGRRVEEISGGFKLLNFAYYRGLRDDDDRAEQNREAQARWREKERQKTQPPKTQPVRVAPPKFIPPTLEQVKLMAAEIGLPEADAEEFWNRSKSIGWVVGKAGHPMKSWPEALKNWKRNVPKFNEQHTRNATRTKPNPRNDNNNAAAADRYKTVGQMGELFPREQPSAPPQT